MRWEGACLLKTIQGCNSATRVSMCVCTWSGNSVKILSDRMEPEHAQMVMCISTALKIIGWECMECSSIPRNVRTGPPIRARRCQLCANHC